MTTGLNRANGWDFDFHALYEEVLRAKGALGATATCIEDLALSAQECVMTILLEKAFHAARSLGVDRLGFGGGVAANSRLRELARARATREQCRTYFPPKEICVDNARMIALGGMLSEGHAAVSGVEGAAPCSEESGRNRRSCRN